MVNGYIYIYMHVCRIIRLCNYGPKLGFEFWCHHSKISISRKEKFNESKLQLFLKNWISLPSCTTCWVLVNLRELPIIFSIKSQRVSYLIKILCENFKEFTWGIMLIKHDVSSETAEIIVFLMKWHKAIFFSFSQEVQHNSIQRSYMNYTSFQFSLKSRHCWRWNHFVPNIILALYRPT